MQPEPKTPKPSRSTSTKPPKPPKPARSSKPARAVAAAWHDGALYALVVRDTTTTVLVLRDGRVVDERSAIARGNRIAVLPSGAVITSTRDGKVKLAPASGKPSSIHLARHVDDLVVCHGIAYAPGAGRRLAKFDEATATWQPTGLREALAPHFPEIDGHQIDGVESVVAGAHGPIVAVHRNSYHHVLVMEYGGTAWRLRADLAHRSNALAWRPDTDTVYSIGNDTFAISATGTIEKLGANDDDAGDRGQWSACWANGALYAATLSRVDHIDVDAWRTTTLLASGKGQVPHNHSLSGDGTNVAFVRAGELHILDGARFVVATL